MKRIWDKILNEPVLLLNLLNALLAAFVVFGLDLTIEQNAAIISVATVILNIIARQSVTPNRKLKQ